MAHNISNASGRAEMFYVGSLPWHGLGTKVDGAVNSAAALAASGLDWDVEAMPVYLADGRAVPDCQAVIRRDTNSILGSVGARYTPVQNRDAFAFLDSLAGDGELLYETAGALGRGERVWMLARVPGELRILNTDDVVKPYLLLANGHDGSYALRCLFTGVRVVCANTLRAATQDKTDGCYIRHTGSIHDRIEEAGRVLGIARKVFDRTQEDMNVLASAKIGGIEAKRYFEEIIPMPADPEKQEVAARNAKETRMKLLDLFDHGVGADMPGIRHTMWTAYNSVTEYVDHIVKTKDRAKALSHDARESRLASNWFGPGANLKAKAWDTAMATVGARD